MKLFKKIIALLVITITLISITGCQEIKDLGVPTIKRYPSGETVRCIWDTKVYDGKVYVGMGDYDKNTHPSDVWAYDIKKRKWVLTCSVDDEAIIRFIELGGNVLVAPGTDPSEDWEMGNYYILQNGKWQKQRVLPNVIHNFDIIDYDGKRMYGVGADYGLLPAIYTEDNGKTFKTFEFFKNGEPYLVKSEDYARGYEFFEVFSELYLLVHHTYVEIQKASASIFKYKDGAFYYYCDGREFFTASRINMTITPAKAPFRNNYFYCTDYLYYTKETETFKTKWKVELPNGERVSDFVIHNGEMYILSFIEKETEGYTVTIYKTQTGVSDFNKVYSFDYGVPPISFDVYNKYAYVGMGDRKTVSDLNGKVLRIRIL